MRKKKAVIQRAKNNEWYYSLHATNGKVLCVSETVKRKGSLISVLKKNFPDFIIIEK